MLAKRAPAVRAAGEGLAKKQRNTKDCAQQTVLTYIKQALSLQCSPKQSPLSLLPLEQH